MVRAFQGSDSVDSATGESCGPPLLPHSVRTASPEQDHFSAQQRQSPGNDCPCVYPAFRSRSMLGLDPENSSSIYMISCHLLHFTGRQGARLSEQWYLPRSRDHNGRCESDNVTRSLVAFNTQVAVSWGQTAMASILTDDLLRLSS